MQFLIFCAFHRLSSLKLKVKKLFSKDMIFSTCRKEIIFFRETANFMYQIHGLLSYVSINCLDEESTESRHHTQTAFPRCVSFHGDFSSLSEQSVYHRTGRGISSPLRGGSFGRRVHCCKILRQKFKSIIRSLKEPVL